MANILDNYALASPLRYTNNWLKLFIVTIGMLTGVSSTSAIAPLFIALSMSFATIYFGKTPLKLYSKIILAPTSFVLLSAIIIAFFFGSGNELFSFSILGYELAINSEGLNMAILILARTLGGMACLFFLALTTPMIELFSVLKATKLPDSFIEISMMMYRYIFVFLDIAMSIKYAQTVRLGYRDFKTASKSFVMLMSILFIRSWEQGEKIYLSMNSRCYDGKMSMFHVKRPVRMPEAILTVAYLGCLIYISYLTRDYSIF